MEEFESVPVATKRLPLWIKLEGGEKARRSQKMIKSPKGLRSLCALESLKMGHRCQSHFAAFRCAIPRVQRTLEPQMKQTGPGNGVGWEQFITANFQSVFLLLLSCN